MNLRNDIEKTAIKSAIICAIITSAIGCLLHFVYEWSGENVIVGLFSAVNESTWEHIKLLYIPFLLSAIIENIIYGRYFRNFFYSKLIGAIVGMFTIVSVYYTYTGIIGKRFAFVDISIFIIGVFVAYGVSLLLMLKHRKKKKDNILEIISIILLAIICALFFVFTYFPPSLNIFVSPTE